MSDSDARKGKIARLPVAIRDEVNKRLLDGQPDTKILPWLNELPDVKAVLQEQFDGKPINATNLSAWRKGGFAEWRDEQAELDEIRHECEWSLRIAKESGGDINDKAAQIIGGKILRVVRAAKDGDLPDLAKAVKALRDGDQEQLKLALKEREVDQRDKTIEIDKATLALKQRSTVEKFMEFYSDQRAKDIVAGSGSNSEKIEALGQIMFPESWKS